VSPVSPDSVPAARGGVGAAPEGVPGLTDGGEEGGGLASAAPTHACPGEDDEGSGEAGGAPAARRPYARSAEQVRQRNRLAMVGVVIVAAIGFLVFKGLTSAVVFFKTANEAVAQRAALGDTTVFQLEGTVVRGSVHTGASGTVNFTISSGKVRVDVTNDGSPPQLFQAGIPVVLVGHFVGTGDHFASDEILVKHSNQYIAAHPGRVRALNGTTR